MSEDIRTKMEQAERKLDKQKALLVAEVSFPKGNKIPASVKDEVIAELKEAAVKLAEGLNLSQSNAGQFTDAQVEVLKLLAERALGKNTKITQSAVSQKSEPQKPVVSDKVTLAPQETVQADLSDLGQYIGHEAMLATLEAVPVGQRGKVQSGSKVRVEAVREDGLLHVITPGGVRFNVDPTLLEF